MSPQKTSPSFTSVSDYIADQALDKRAKDAYKILAKGHLDVNQHPKIKHNRITSIVMSPASRLNQT